jgi:hypothetical protein
MLDLFGNDSRMVVHLLLALQWYYCFDVHMLKSPVPCRAELEMATLESLVLPITCYTKWTQRLILASSVF